MDKRYLLELSTKERKIAYLVGFDVDKHSLKKDHETWLLTKVVADGHAQWANNIAQNRNAFYRIWLLGTTSRTASFEYNLRLSKKRVKAVEQFLQNRFGSSSDKTKIPYVIDTGGLSESIAFLSGKSDRKEDPLDRSVLVLAQWYTVPDPPKPPPVRRPVLPCQPKTLFKDFKIRLVSGAAVTGEIPVKKVGKVGLKSYDVNIEILDVEKKLSAFYKWEGKGLSGGLLKKSLDSKNRKLPVTKGPWHSFTVVCVKSASDFEGPAMYDYGKILYGAISFSNFYFAADSYWKIYDGIKIEDFKTGIPSTSLDLLNAGTQRGKLTLIN